MAFVLTRSCLSGNFQVHGIFSRNVFVIYTDSYYTKRLNFGRATHGMIARDGSFWISHLQSQTNLSVTTKRRHTCRIKTRSCHLFLSSQESSMLHQSRYQKGSAEVPNVCNLFIMQRRIISFTLCLCYSRNKDHHYSGNSEFVVPCCWFHSV